MKFDKISNKSISPEVKGQEVYYQHLPDNGKTYDPDVCGCDCIEYNYFYGTDDTAVPSQQLHCILYDVYVSGSTWFGW